MAICAATVMQLELRHLAALVAVADAGTISRAADDLGYTQSAVSQQIAALEKAVGGPVFERPGGPRPLRLTPAGDALLAHARTVLGQLRVAEADVRAVLAGDGGSLRVGSVQSAGTRIIPDVVRRFAAERPGVEILLRESTDPDELLARLLDGDLDVTFCELPIGVGPVETRVVLTDPIVLLVPAGSPEAAMEAVPVEHAVGLPLIGYRNPGCRALTRRPFDAIDGVDAADGGPRVRLPVRRQHDPAGLRRRGARLRARAVARRRHRRPRHHRRPPRARGRAAPARPGVAGGAPGAGVARPLRRDRRRGVRRHLGGLARTRCTDDVDGRRGRRRRPAPAVGDRGSTGPPPRSRPLVAAPARSSPCPTVPGCASAPRPSTAIPAVAPTPPTS